MTPEQSAEMLGKLNDILVSLSKVAFELQSEMLELAGQQAILTYVRNPEATLH